MAKKATIVVSLVKESNRKKNSEIEKEISQELSEGSSRIPWCKEVEKVSVTES